MLLRFLRLFVCAVAVILVVSPARAVPEKVPYTGEAKPGTSWVRPANAALYLVTGKGQAIKYPVGVGRSGQQWFGATRIVSKHIKPAWKLPGVDPRPPLAGLLHRNPARRRIRWAPRRWCCADNELAIHGTNNPGSIGGFVSAGCIRMHNKDVMDLYGRVRVGTRVVFVK